MYISYFFHHVYSEKKTIWSDFYYSQVSDFCHIVFTVSIDVDFVIDVCLSRISPRKYSLKHKYIVNYTCNNCKSKDVLKQ